MGTVVNMSHLLGGRHRAAPAVTAAARHRNKCKGNSNPVQLLCHAEDLRPEVMAGLAAEMTANEAEETFKAEVRLQAQAPPTRVVTNTFMMITHEVVEWGEAAVAVVEAEIMVLVM